jgi:mannose-6-phosphate isomerase-like protein (cupin superfamily)
VLSVSSERVREPVAGEGYALASLDGLGEGYGFRKIRKELGVSEFGVNAIVVPAGFESGFHLHERQQELYFVHQGKLEVEFGDGTKHRLEPGSLVRVDASMPRKFRNVGDGDAVYVVIGAAGGYVGRDGLLPEGEERVARPGD